ncbi:MAG: type IV secretory system conjugative DNA transfer family protein [Pseudomonadota bacterium]
MVGSKTQTGGSEALMEGVPRGKSWEYLRHQTPPQARWLEPDKIAASKALAYDPETPKGKLLLGALGDKLIGIRDNRHVLTVAGSRAGKSVTVISNLYFYDGSVFAIDPKGELANKTAAARKRLGQRVYVLDPFEITEGAAAECRARFNPLNRLTLDNRFIVEDAYQIADGLVISTGEEKDPHWNEAAKGFLIGLILFVAVSVVVKDEDRHLGTVRSLINQALDRGEEGEIILLQLALSTVRRLTALNHRDLAGAIEGAFRGFYAKSAEELGSVLSTIHRHTQFLDYGAMKSVLTGHDVDLTDLKADPKGVSIFLCLPATRMGLCNRWFRILLNQLFDAMEREQRQPPSNVLVCLDEFPVLGFMSQLQDAAGQIASFHVTLWVILQDWGQGKALYKERWESFAANSGIFQAFGNVDLATTEYISKRLDKTVVQTSRPGEAGPSQREQGLTGRSETFELYDLLTPSEVALLFARNDKQRRQLLLWAGVNPMVIQRVAYYDTEGPLAAHMARIAASGG